MLLAFLGTPEPAAKVLRAVIGASHEVAIVVTRPDRRRGRGKTLSPSPVKIVAEEFGLTIGHSLSDLEGYDVELGVVVAYGAIIPASLLEHLPMLNVHFSLLPRWRGAAPVERAILAGDELTGVSVMTLEAGLDTGPVHLERRTLVAEKTSAELLDELAQLGAGALLEVLDSPELLAHPHPQVGEVTYAHKLTTDTFHLTPETPVELMMRTVRLGRAHFFLDGRRVRVDAARKVVAALAPGTVGVLEATPMLGAIDGALALERVQPEGSRPMSGAEWWSGTRLDLSSVRWS